MSRRRDVYPRKVMCRRDGPRQLSRTAITLKCPPQGHDECNGDISPNTRKYNRIPMRAFEVSVNGEKLCLAGIGDDGVLTTIVTWAGRQGDRDLFLQVGGLISRTKEHVHWINQ